MKPAPFDHLPATTVEDAVTALATHDNAVVLAGGQSLLPLMAMRHVRPALLVDVNHLDLAHVQLTAGTADSPPELRLGALVRHRRLERDAVIRGAAPLLAEAAGWIGSPAIRHRGTLGGSLAHADPTAELPAVLVALNGHAVVRGPGGRQRAIAARDLFAGPHSTTLTPGELVVDVRVPAAGPAHGAAFCEWAARHGDLPDAGVAVVVERAPDGRCRSARAAACAVAATPLDLTDAISPALGERETNDRLLHEVARRVEATILQAAPPIGTATVDHETADARQDDHPIARRDREDRAQLAGLLAARALHRAFTRSAAPDDRAEVA